MMPIDGIQTATPLLPGGPDIAGLSRRFKGEGDLDDRELTDVSRQLEGVFVSVLVKKMREGMTGDGLFGKGTGSDIYGGFFDQMMGEELSRRGGLGISEMVVRAAMDRKESVAPEELSARIEEKVEKENDHSS